MTRLKTFIALCTLAIATSGCGAGFAGLFPMQEVDTSGAIDSDNGGGVHGPSGEKVTPFCSPLSFKGVSWDPNLTSWARRSLSISLSLTGSFEGHEGWINLANNFDGMGMSAGLLNQTLGTGSLQPLMAQLRKSSPGVMPAIFSSSHLSSLNGMLNKWESTTGFKSMSRESAHGELSFAHEVTSSALDADYDVAGEVHTSANESTAAAASVTWAKNTLYTSSGAFIATWKTEIQKMLGRPEYVSLQIKEALDLHEKTMGYVQRVKIDELRTYLLMFDIVVQNGGITAAEFTEWEAKVKSAGLKTSVSKLKALVDIRNRRVRSEYQADVRSRKYAIIDGSGTIHGRARKLTTEYCYLPTEPID